MITSWQLECVTVAERTARRDNACLAEKSSAGGTSLRNMESEVARSLKGMPTASLHPSARYNKSGFARSCTRCSIVRQLSADRSIHPEVTAFSRACPPLGPKRTIQQIGVRQIWHIIRLSDSYQTDQTTQHVQYNFEVFHCSNNRTRKSTSR